MVDGENTHTTNADGLSRADPTDLDALREVLAVSDPEGKLYPIDMCRIEIGPEALDALTETVSSLSRGGKVVLVADATPMYRGGEDLRE